MWSVVSPQRLTSTVRRLSQMCLSSSSLGHCRPRRLLLPRAAFASCGRKPKSFFSSSAHHRPISRSCQCRRSMDAFHCPCRPDVLISALQRILDGDFKILIQEPASRSVIALPSARLPIAAVVTSEEARNDAFDGSFSIRVRHGLSEREEQILKSVVKGHGNKMIARTLDIAEATVKVHMKSVLRKIRVANRTQAAIWALENGYAANNLHPELPRLEATLQPAPRTEAQAVR